MPKYRNKGIGQVLVNNIINQLQIISILALENDVADTANHTTPIYRLVPGSRYQKVTKT